MALLLHFITARQTDIQREREAHRKRDRDKAGERKKEMIEKGKRREAIDSTESTESYCEPNDQTGCKAFIWG